MCSGTACFLSLYSNCCTYYMHQTEKQAYSLRCETIPPSSLRIREHSLLVSPRQQYNAKLRQCTESWGQACGPHLLRMPLMSTIAWTMAIYLGQRVHGSRVQGSTGQGSKDPRVHGPRVQGSTGLWFQGSKGPRSKGPRVHGSRVQGSKGPRVKGPRVQGSRVQGSKGPRV